MRRRHRIPASLGMVLGGLLCASAGAAEPASVAAKIVFLDRQRAAEEIVDDSADPYFSLLQTIEMSAKTGMPISGETLDEQRAECRRRYQESVLEFHPVEKNVILWALAQVQPVLEQRYSRVARTRWSFIKIDSHIESGLPHSRGEHIVLSPRVLRRFVHVRRRWSPEDALSLIAETLLHELFHVYQRQNRELFEKLYAEVWGFRRVESLECPPWVTKYQLINPDSARSVWAYPVRTGQATTWILPTLVIGEPQGIRRVLGVPSLISDVRMIALELRDTPTGFTIRLDRRGFPVFRRLLDFEEYREDFPFSSAPFHPSEMAAEGFAAVAVSQIAALSARERTGPRKSHDLSSLALRRWFLENLN